MLIARASDNAGNITIATTVNSMYWAANSGASVLNLSFGTEPTDTTNYLPCPNNPNTSRCQAITWAANRDIVMVASAGNGMNTSLQFPAVDARTIAASASQFYQGTRGFLWTEEAPQPGYGFVGSDTGPGMDTHGIMAPGRDVLSTVYTSADWNPYTRCGDGTTWGGTAGPGYGVCTGTSMAAPFITGIVALMRAANPLLSSTTIRSYLLSSGNNAGAPNQTLGYGIPDARVAVNSALSSANRLTPLFSFFGPFAYDYFYTTSPQQGSAAAQGTLPPYFAGEGAYNSTGTSVPGISTFPAATQPALAQAWVFTNHVNPANSSVNLKPLYRLSYKCGDPVPPGVTTVCGSYPFHVDHFYATSYTEVQTYISQAGYKLDGIEGYVYPYGYAQPANTELLIRAYNSTYDDHAIFPQSLQSSMASAGYTANVTDLGYVYKNTGVRPTY